MDLSFPAGTTATFYCTFALANSVPIDPDTSPTATIYQGTTQVFASITMTRISLGYYTASLLIPSNQPVGPYSILYQGLIETIPFQKSENFEISPYGSPPMVMPNFYCSWDDVNAVLLGLDVADLPATFMSRVTSTIIPQIKREIDGLCRQNFNITTTTLFLDGSTTDKLILPFYPVVSLNYCILRVIPSISWYTFRRWRNINVIDSEGRKIAVQGGPEPNDNTVQPPYLPGQFTFDPTIPNADLFVDCASGHLIIPPRILYLEMNAIPFWNYTFLQGQKNVEVQYTYGYQPNCFPEDFRIAAAKKVAIQILMWKAMSVGAGAQTITQDGVSRNFGSMPYNGIITQYTNESNMTFARYKRMDVA